MYCHYFFIYVSIFSDNNLILSSIVTDNKLKIIKDLKKKNLFYFPVKTGLCLLITEFKPSKASSDENISER